MRSNLLSVVSGRQSIRMQMIWSFVASIALGSIVAVSIPKGLVFDVPVSIIAFFGTFAVCFYLFTRHTIVYLLRLSEGLGRISGGNLRCRIPGKRKDELGQVAHNINEMAEKLEAMLERERKAEKAKMQLITGVSHDLRTPLTSIIGYLELIRGKEYRDEAEFARFIGNTYNKAQQLRGLIDELFEYTRLSQSEVKLEPSTIDLREMLSQMLAEFEPLAKETSSEIEVSLPPHPLFVVVDAERIRRAIDNLLTNASKFSVKPGIIRVELTSAADFATIAIENEGTAITKEQEERLFERFYKVDDARSPAESHGGAGLGLSIARGIVELHGGRVEFSHDAGRFSFKVRLPVRAASGEAAK